MQNPISTSCTLHMPACHGLFQTVGMTIYDMLLYLVNSTCLCLVPPMVASLSLSMQNVSTFQLK